MVATKRQLLALFVILLSVACGSTYGQRRDTIFQEVYTDQNIVAFPTGSSSPVTNIGQTQHLLVVQLEDNGGACTIGQILVSMVGGSISSNPEDTVVFGETYARTFAAPTALEETVILRGNGAFPLVFVTYQTAASATNCKLSVFYSGSIQSVPTLVDNGAEPAGLTFTCANGVTAADTNTTIVPAGPLDTQILVHGLVVIDSDATGREISIGYVDGVPAFVPIIGQITLSQGSNVILNNAGRPWFTIPADFPLTLRTGTGTTKVTACALTRYLAVF